MNYAARLSRRRVIGVAGSSNQAKLHVKLELGAMQCKRLGHILGKPMHDVGAGHKTITVCRRCMRVIESDDKDVQVV